MIAFLHRWFGKRISPKLVRKLSRRSKNVSPVEVVIRVANLQHLIKWHFAVQKTHIDQDPERIDRGWNWPLYLLRGIFFERILRRRTLCLQLLCRGRNDLAVPVGQVMFSVGYPHLDHKRKRSVFIWYLASAPEDFLLANGIPADLKLLRPLIDCCIQSSYHENFGGRIGLHADPHGTKDQQDSLFDKYEGIGLQVLRRKQRKISAVRPDDGRYFFANEPVALYLSRKLDHLRL